jgi:broad specificity phosphatase PhoE
MAEPGNTFLSLRSLWLVRHAESEGNVADLAAQDAGEDRLRLTARDPDVELSGTGREQARALGESWLDLPPEDRPDRVVSSPYRRALATAEIAVASAGWQLDVRRDERLRERDLGLLDGWTKGGIERKFPEEAERRAWLGKFYYRPPGGESWADVAGRVRAVLETMQPQYAGARLLVVSHQAVLMLFRYVLEGLDEAAVLELDATQRLANTGVVRYRFTDGIAHLEAAGDTSHLDRRDAQLTEEPDAATVPE